MKKTICLFILCTVLLVSCNNNSKPYTTGTDSKVEISCTYDFFDMDVDNEGRIYVCDKEVIRVIDPKNNTEFTFKGTLKFGRLVTVGDNRVCVFDEKDRSIKVFDYKGNDVSEYIINADFVHGITYIEGSLFILSSQDNAQERYIQVMDLSNGIVKKLDISGVIGFSKYEKDKIIILSKDSINNIQTGFYFKIFNYKKSVVENEFESNITPDRFCYDLHNNLIFYAGPETIYSMDIDNKKGQTVYSTQDTIFMKTSIVNNMLYCADMKGQVVHIVDINSRIKGNQQLSPDTIKVFSNNDSLCTSRYGKKGVEIFKKNNPGVEVLFEFTDNKEYEQKLKLKLMARDSDFDVFIVNNNIIPELVKNQAFYDLSPFDSIVKTLNSMSCGIKQLCSAGETIIGVPEYISLDVWSVNESLLESLGLQLPEGSWNWDDFYEFSINARKDLNSDGEMDTYTMACDKQFFVSRFMLTNYNCAYLDVINGYASYNRKEFIDLIKLSKKLFDEKLIMENSNIPITKLENTLFSMKDPISIEKNEKIIPVPSLSSKRAYSAGVSLFCVNKFSAKVDKAVEYITTLTLKELHEESPRIELLYEDLFSERVDIDCSKDYFDILKYITLSRSQKDLAIFSSNTLNDYYSGKIAAEEAAKQIYIKAQMILTE